MVVRNVKLSLVQFNSKIMDVASNIEKAKSFMEEASSKGSDLIVFPELFTTGYNPDSIGDHYFDLAEDETGYSVKELSKAAADFNINVVAPIALKSNMPGVIYNSAVVINRKGDYQGSYHKSHVWAKERTYFKEGSEFPVFKLDIGVIGLMICYDGGFPEVSRLLALKGAELILCPSAFPTQDKDLWDIYFKSRSLENGCFVAGINRVGTGEDAGLFGNNQLYNPRGKQLLYGNLHEEEMQTVEINLDDVAEYRKQIPYLKDLRLEIYK
jgi:predicted amidohydrolase